MAQREIRALTREEETFVESKIIEVRRLLGYNLGDKLSYEMLMKGWEFMREGFFYTPDEEGYGKSDYWNTLAFDWFMLDGYLEDDCDGKGYELIEFMIRVFGVELNKIFRVACSTETNEPHFVCWVIVDGIYYQIENRLIKPRTVREMHDLGYEYWHYSDMTPKNIKTNTWYEARARVETILFQTRASKTVAYMNPEMLSGGEGGAKSDHKILTKEADVASEVDAYDAVSYIEKSRTLMTSGSLMTGGVVAVGTALAQQKDWKIVAMWGGYILIGAIFWWLRAKTTKSLKAK